MDHIVGNDALDALAHRDGVKSFVPYATRGAEPHAGEQPDEFCLHIDRFTARRHRRYAMHLLASITPSQRSGIGEVARRRWNLYFKGEWDTAPA